MTLHLFIISIYTDAREIAASTWCRRVSTYSNRNRVCRRPFGRHQSSVSCGRVQGSGLGEMGWSESHGSRYKVVVHTAVVYLSCRLPLIPPRAPASPLSTWLYLLPQHTSPMPHAPIPNQLRYHTSALLYCCTVLLLCIRTTAAK